MNKNKLIFAIIGVIVVVVIFVLFIGLSNTTKKSNVPKNASLKIRILNDSADNFNTFLDTFKATNKDYSGLTFDVKSFSSYKDYFYSLIGSFINGTSPDLFVVNNEDGNFFDSQTVGLNPQVFKVDEFRKKYDLVFQNDLITSQKDGDTQIEYLKGMPMGYEVLGLYYNFLYLKGKKLDTWSYVNDAITELKTLNGLQSVIGLGNGSTVYSSSKIIAQFFLMNGISSLEKTDGTSIRDVISNYFKFADINQDNGYNYYFDDLSQTGKNDLDLFSSGSLQMVIGYPRMMQQIDQKGFNKIFLRATPFPSFTDKTGKTMVEYNYFVINKNTANMSLAESLLSYFNTDAGQKAYLKNFNFYFPSNVNLLQDRLSENVMSGYYIQYKDFYNPNLELSTFNKGNKVGFDDEVPSLLDKGLNGIDLFDNFKKRLLCLSSELISQDGESKFCK